MAVLLYAVHWMSWTGSLSSVSDKHSLKTPTPLRGLPISAQGTKFLKNTVNSNIVADEISSSEWSIRVHT